MRTGTAMTYRLVFLLPLVAVVLVVMTCCCYRHLSCEKKVKLENGQKTSGEAHSKDITMDIKKSKK
jgi:hypothetical protein